MLILTPEYVKTYIHSSPIGRTFELELTNYTVTIDEINHDEYEGVILTKSGKTFEYKSNNLEKLLSKMNKQLLIL